MVTWAPRVWLQVKAQYTVADHREFTTAIRTPFFIANLQFSPTPTSDVSYFQLLFNYYSYNLKETSVKKILTYFNFSYG